MPRRLKPNYDFDIHVDPSCLSDPMDAETLSQSGGIAKQQKTEEEERQQQGDVDSSEEILPSVEDDDEDEDYQHHQHEPNSPGESALTEEAIQAAARDILDRLEKENQDEEDGGSELDPLETHSHTSRAARGGGATAADDSSSQRDEDVFSDKSPRSSLGSYDMGADEASKLRDFTDNMTTVHNTRSARVSDVSQYDEDGEEGDFMATMRGTPRASPFRTPSELRAMQAASPTASVFNGGSPKPSNNRRFPTVSRLGTPGIEQYSPRKTPDRLKPRREAPLVLLHVTLLPLRWAWGDLVDGLEAQPGDDLSPDLRALRDAWRLLQDRLGDTTCERGILLGHPQEDYEVLEERLLDALELPLRRRARILECGHYLGPSNLLTDEEYEELEYVNDHNDDAESAFDENGEPRPAVKRHWCTTCQNDIRYEALGPGKVFRVKVYASNGLMKAGAWAACWKEMERVDVELEPVVTAAAQDELARLASGAPPAPPAAARKARGSGSGLTQEEEDEIASEVAQQFEEEKKQAKAEDERSRGRRGRRRLTEEARAMHARVVDAEDEDEAEAAATRSSSEERRRVDEERYREIYGESPPAAANGSEEREATPAPAPDTGEPYPGAYGDAYKGQDSRRGKLDGASLPQLVVASVRVLLQDQKNIAIIALSVFALILAVRTARRELPYDTGIYGIMASAPDMQHVPEAEGLQAAVFEQDFTSEEVPDIEVQEGVEGYEAYEAFETREYLGTEESLEFQEYQDTTEEQDPVEESECTEQASAGFIAEAGDVVAAAPSIVCDPQGAASEQPRGTAIVELEGASNGHHRCVTLSAAGKLDTVPAPSKAPEPIEAEVLTQKRTVKVVQTVTETETQVEYVTSTATEFVHQPAPTSSFVMAFEAVVICYPLDGPMFGQSVQGNGMPLLGSGAPMAELEGQ